jgi:hypothetical protein
LLLVFLGGRASVAIHSRADAPRRQERPEPPPHTLSSRTQPRARPNVRLVERPFLVRPVEAAALEDEAVAQRYRTQQAHDLINLVRGRVARVERRTRDEGAEAAANQAYVYLQGWLDGVVRVAPDLVDELATEVERSLCTDDTSDAELMVMSRLLQAINAAIFFHRVRRGPGRALLELVAMGFL